MFYFTVVEKFFHKYLRSEIPVKMLAIRMDNENVYNRGGGTKFMFGRIENGCFIEDATGDWWIRDDRYYPEIYESRMTIDLRLKKTCQYYMHVDENGFIKVHHEDDIALITDKGILVGRKLQLDAGTDEEEGD